MKSQKLIIAPSILAADFSQLGAEIRRVEKLSDVLHVDVMDGRFVPNISVGPMVVRSIKSVSNLPVDVHLMIETPWNHIEPFQKVGARAIIVHQEACGERLVECLKQIRQLGCASGVSIKPKTPLSAIRSALPYSDMVLLMTVNPGFGGQSFMPEVLPKIKELRAIYDKDIAVDGGINPQTCADVLRAGANYLVAGTAIFKQKDAGKAIQQMRSQAK